VAVLNTNGCGRRTNFLSTDDANSFDTGGTVAGHALVLQFLCNRHDFRLRWSAHNTVILAQEYVGAHHHLPDTLQTLCVEFGAKK